MPRIWPRSNARLRVITIVRCAQRLPSRCDTPAPPRNGNPPGNETVPKECSKDLGVGWGPRTNEMVGGSVEILKVVRRIVPLIENQGDALTFLSKHLVASD